MASEMRRAAKALVEPHPHTIKSDYPPGEASKRLDQLADAIAEVSADNVVIRTPKGDHFVGTWRPSDGRYVLEGVFLPPPGTQRMLKGFAIALTLLLVATAWTFLTAQETSLKVSTSLFTLLAILAFPYVIVGLSSQRSGREAAIARALQRALEREIR
jgi:hypothetical protein